MQPTIRISEDIYQIKIPVPFPLLDVNCYLVRETDGWAMIDTGLQHDLAHAAWQAAFHSLQMTVRDVRRIYVTHAHPDHYGLAGHFQRLTDAPVYMLDEEVRVAPIEWQSDGAHLRVLSPFLHKHGTPAGMVEGIAARSLQVLQMVEPQSVMSPLREGQEVRLGGEAYRVLWMPGHADGHFVLHGLENGVLFVGDHVLIC